jgi:hypothetical protein
MYALRPPDGQRRHDWVRHHLGCGKLTDRVVTVHLTYNPEPGTDVWPHHVEHSTFNDWLVDVCIEDCLEVLDREDHAELERWLDDEAGGPKQE